MQGAIDGLNESKLSDADRTSLKSAIDKANSATKNGDGYDVSSELNTLNTAINKANGILEKEMLLKTK